MTRVTWLVLGVAAVILMALGALAGRIFYQGPTKVERRVDSTLATVPAYQDTVRARDSALLESSRREASLKRQSAQERARADSAEAKADSLQQWADDLAEVPTNLTLVEQNTRLRTALAAQKEASAQFQVTTEMLKRERTTDSLRLDNADRTIAELIQWRADDQARINRLTKDLDDLRKEGQKRGKFLGFLPSWTDEALMIAGTAKVAYEIGRAAGKES